MRNKGQIHVELQGWLGDDRAIAESAWTSSTTLQGKEKRTDEDVKRILTEVLTRPIQTLEDVGHVHGSPFESVVFRFWMKIPISTDRQHMTHRIASHNGMSGRYRTMPNEWLKMPEDILNVFYDCYEDDLIGEYEYICGRANDLYRTCLERMKQHEKMGLITNTQYKRLREFYRGVLPQNNMTERVTTMNLRSFANYQMLRNSAHAQEEIHTVAQLMLEEVKESNMCPVTIEILEKNKWILV
jgi:thymidylate synthase (FAD)